MQLLAAAALLYAIGWRRRRWRTMWVPLSVVVGALTATLAYWYFSTLGIASEPAPWQMWLWVALVGVATAVAITGWRSAGWWRRNVSVFAASFCMLSMGLTINAWLGYFPTVDTAWSQLTNRPLPNQVDPQTVQSLKHRAIAPRREWWCRWTRATADPGSSTVKSGSTCRPPGSPARLHHGCPPS